MTNEEKIRAHLHISGRVQGVGFRWSTRSRAQELELTGWVRNLMDGRVEAVFEGPTGVVEQAVSWCRHGPPSARVENVSVNKSEATGEFRHFGIRG